MEIFYEIAEVGDETWEIATAIVPNIFAELGFLIRQQVRVLGDCEFLFIAGGECDFEDFNEIQEWMEEIVAEFKGW